MSRAEAGREGARQYDFGFPHFHRDLFRPPRLALPRRELLVGPHRLFLAAIPDPTMAALIWKLALELKLGLGLSGSLLKPENLHMTVLFLGGFAALTEDLVSRARRIGAGVLASPFEFIFDLTMSFDSKKGRYPFVISGAEARFRMLQQAAWIAAALEGKAAASRPHMTLVWANELIPTMPLGQSISFAIEEIVLVHSHYGTGRHEHLGRWGLRG